MKNIIRVGDKFLYAPGRCEMPCANEGHFWSDPRSNGVQECLWCGKVKALTKATNKAMRQTLRNAGVTADKLCRKIERATKRHRSKATAPEKLKEIERLVHLWKGQRTIGVHIYESFPSIHVAAQLEALSGCIEAIERALAT